MTHSVVVSNDSLYESQIQEVDLKLSESEGLYRGQVIIFLKDGRRLTYSGFFAPDRFLDEFGFSIGSFLINETQASKLVKV